jgi:glycosyltransferase involved in cell wall biosynthesis
VSSDAAARVRRAILHTRAGQALKRIIRPSRAVPRRLPAHPSRLAAFPDDELLPIDIRDPQMLARALGAHHATDVVELMARPGTEEPRTIANVLLVSHCDFTGNSAVHVYAIAEELARLGFSPAIAVPQAPEGMAELGGASLPAIAYDDVSRLVFPDGRGPDVVHAFSPRELVRVLTTELVRRFRIPYVVHLEDDDASILAADLGLTDASRLRELPLPILDELVRPGHAHPLRSRQFLELAAGATVITERLLDLLPSGLPARVLHAGFDESVLTPKRSRDEVRAELGLSPGDVVVTYTGSIHSANVEDVRSLYVAVAALRRTGRAIVLVKTGKDGPEALRLPRLRNGIRDLGRVPRDRIADLLHAADILVQPGAPGAFNDFRFPSKLPDYLASGRPVVLPRANIGLELADGNEAFVIERGDADELAHAIERLADDPELRTRLGAGGRAFALRRLTWSSNGALVADFYREIASRQYATATDLDRVPLPLRVVALVPGDLSGEEARLLDEYGLSGIGHPEIQTEPARPYADALADWLGSGAAGGDPIPFPSSSTDLTLYKGWVRKAVLQALAHQPAIKPMLYVSAGEAWNDGRRTEFLEATRAGVRDGLRQSYASRGLELDDAQAERLVR